MTPQGTGGGPLPRSAWFRPQFLAMCAAAAATIVLSGCDIAFVAALRAFDTVSLLGPVLAIWGLGSVIGGLVYGMLHRSISAFLLLGGLSLATIPIALAPSVWPLAVLGFVAGLFCAPTITATVDQLSRVVPDAARGEAIGWHGSAMTAGSALGAPMAGLAIDRWGWAGGFVSVSLVGRGRRGRGGKQDLPPLARAGGKRRGPSGQVRAAGWLLAGHLTGLAVRGRDRGLVVLGLTLVALSTDRLCPAEAPQAPRMAQRAREAQASRFHPRRHARSSLQSQPPGSRSARLRRRTDGAPRQACSV